MMTLPFPLAPTIYQRIRPWMAEGRVSIPLAVNAEWTNIATYTVQTIERAYTVGYGVEVNDPLYDYNGSIIFRIIYGSQPVQDFSSFQLQQGTIAAPVPFATYLDPGGIITLQARRAVVSSAAQTVSAIIRGIAWPQAYCIPFDTDKFNINKR